MNPWILFPLIGYLLGSIPFGYLLVRVFRHQDIRATGSGNIGATNVARSGAKGLGLATLLLDCGKAFLAVWLARHYVPSSFSLAVLTALAAILGHVFPVWLGFRGGKGVASALGLLLALSWPVGALTFAVFLVVVLLTRLVSLGSILGAASVPFLALYFVHPMSRFALAGFIAFALIVILKHHANIGRLLHGTEPRFGSRSTPHPTSGDASA